MLGAFSGARGGSLFEPLRVDGFPRLWSANLLWYLARWMEQVVVGWLVLELTNSPWLVALVGFWRNGPLLLFGLFGGELADRFDRRLLLATAQILTLIVTGATLALLLAGELTYPLIALGQLLVGLAWSIEWPARRSAMMDLVGGDRIVRAVLLDSTSMNISRIAGPMLGGGLIAAAGVPACYGLLLASSAVSLFVILGLRLPRVVRPAGGALWRSLRDGLEHCRASGVIMPVLVITVAMNMLGFPYQQLLPVFARDLLGVGPAELGLLAAGDGIGALVAGIAFGALGSRLSRPGAAFLVGSLGMCAALALFAVSTDYLLSLALLIAFGLSHASFSAFQSSLILANTSAELRGRAMGVLTIAIGTSPLGALEMGLIASWLGAPVAVLTGALAAMVWVAWVGWRYPQLRRG